MAHESIRQQLIGAWELIEYVAYLPDDPSNKVHPMGPNATGIIMYTPDGYMSAQLLKPNQAAFDTAQGTANEWAQVGKKFIGYTGQFYLDERGDEKGRPILIHHMRNASLPSLRGDKQRRLVGFSNESDGKYLVLGVEGTVAIGTERRVLQLRWRRLPYNDKTTPQENL
ncbi:hypothetical protein P152DRAFT_457714 [Eremomyces bilateralis CBS 781.70]|uniref:Lipocalin-like domain-containing protein n=1 Tax=Eremomyces bilateralis CBS 781.70 TaxID=1392243 RepID=A0A6G1G5X6_9PEZI|nr:uncharacterized protein P152DRAFT_457714 [Eremomyces bilateralis CBS 781.70]KAF1813351.1 hypothetical protein P152DRAFT_457714 [Eremomyces bilateralis CBS 781.70]